MSNRTPAHLVRKVQVDFTDDPGFTEQAHKDEVSIHNIMRKYKQTGVIEHNAQYEGEYMDMTSAPDFYEAKVIIAEANSMFETVPAHIRKDFDNDPAQFLDFMQDPANYQEIEEYGLSTAHLPEPAPPAPESPPETTTEPPAPE